MEGSVRKNVICTECLAGVHPGASTSLADVEHPTEPWPRVSTIQGSHTCGQGISERVVT